ncbi:hypothetical protein CH63R_07548 [Colletotrichum higginsianum IMI 349063]|uniref:Uncharacterized protein n=1 Tax=Colletotrichum higginsianum (strain IMI 349063) TaxID=759273 RepID=A0A1B7Y9M2_COLHI|nr:hypothetical protein CH63R_07548 [Colletotrichum higginsianum IMI 349063]OBR08783.1 hypothetical protein CH63R_07548 [Colletotrichum higginsianum IMI 349063]
MRQGVYPSLARRPPSRTSPTTVYDKCSTTASTLTWPGPACLPSRGPNAIDLMGQTATCPSSGQEMMNGVEAMVTDTHPALLHPSSPVGACLGACLHSRERAALPAQSGRQAVRTGPVRARSCLHPLVRIDFFPLLWANLGPLAPRFVPPFHTSPHLQGAHRLLTLQKADYTVHPPSTLQLS